MEKSLITDDDKIHNNTQRMQILLDTQQQQLQTVTSRLGTSDACENLFSKKHRKPILAYTLPVHIFNEKFI